jgi:hypothetical protein
VTQTQIKPTDTTPQELNDDDLQAQMRLMKEKTKQSQSKIDRYTGPRPHRL